MSGKDMTHDTGMMDPTRVHDLDESNAFLHQAAGRQARVRDAALALLSNGLGAFLAPIEYIRSLRLHAEGVRLARAYRILLLKLGLFRFCGGPPTLSSKLPVTHRASNPEWTRPKAAGNSPAIRADFPDRQRYLLLRPDRPWKA